VELVDRPTGCGKQGGVHVYMKLHCDKFYCVCGGGEKTLH
jgi:hypothetical protein